MPYASTEKSKEYFRAYYKKRKQELDAYKKEWIENNPEKAKEHQQRYLEKTVDKRRSKQRERLYGLQASRFDEMMEEQNNACALCLTAFTEPRKIFVDHCHSVGNVRGLLCPSCNTALGLIKDDLGWLARAKKYLTEK